MTRLGSLFHRYIPIALLLILIGGCKRFTQEGEEQIFGTATINGKSYKESKRWYWNSTPYPASIIFWKYHRYFEFEVNLKPAEAGLPNYRIYFYAAIDESELMAKRPYKFEPLNGVFDKSIYTYYSIVDVPFLRANKSTILPNGGDGIAVLFSDSSSTPTPLMGTLVIDEFYTGTRNCRGSYSLTSTSDGADKLTIDGKFETDAVNF